MVKNFLTKHTQSLQLPRDQTFQNNVIEFLIENAKYYICNLFVSLVEELSPRYKAVLYVILLLMIIFVI